MMGKRLASVAGPDNPNHMFVPRHELKLVREELAKVPELATDLGVAITKRARLGEVGRSRKPRRPSEQPLPYHIAAADIADQLHNFLTGWVRLICEHRAMDAPAIRPESPLPDEKSSWPDHIPAMAPLSRWLDRNAVALAMTPGSETVLDELRGLIRAAEVIACPPLRPREPIDAQELAEARKLQLNATGIVTLAKELGEEYRHLTRRRVHVLKEAGRIQPILNPKWPDLLLFNVGEVMDAHLLLPIRERHDKAS